MEQQAPVAVLVPPCHKINLLALSAFHWVGKLGLAASVAVAKVVARTDFMVWAAKQMKNEKRKKKVRLKVGK